MSLDTQWTDVLLAIDAPLVGYALDGYVAGGTFPWRADSPTISLLGDGDQVAPWQQMVTVAGELLGEPEEAEALIDEAEQRSADVAEELPGLKGKTFALANYVPGDSIYVVADPDDGSRVFFAQLGMEIDPDILAIVDGVSDRAEISLEQIGLLDADLLVLFTNDADTSTTPPWLASTPPTPLSIPYSLDLARPALEAAALR